MDKAKQLSQSDEVHQSFELNDANYTTKPPYPFVLSFKNLSYSIQTCKNGSRKEYEDKLLLNDISGEAKQRQIMAFLGASGCGKSTLIDALAGRISKDRLKGLISINGHEVLRSKKNSIILKSISAYVMQDTVLFPGLTVKETLMYSAEFCLPRTVSSSNKRERVEEVINQLGLRHASNMIIGEEGLFIGVSGGEKKRVSIGIEIIHNPAILFLDEPTSGLDSTSAVLVARVLQGIARRGSIVILSVHQPSSRILNLLDELIILSEGKPVYNGSTSDITKFFAACNHPIPENENKVEYVLDLISELNDDSSGCNGITSLVDFNKSRQKRNTNCNDAVNDSRVLKGKLLESSRMVITDFGNPIWVEIYVLVKRAMMNSKRRPKSFGVRFGAVILAGVMLATLFWRLDESQKGAQERVAFFASSIITTFFICAEAMPHFLQERSIFIRETAYNTYRRSSYVLSNAMIALPSLILFSLTFSVITFWAVGLEGGLSGFVWFFGFMLASFWTGHSFVTFLSATVSHVLTGYVLVVAFLAQFTLFSGLFIPRSQIPEYWMWFHYMSLVKYPYQGVLLNEFDNPMKCLVNGAQMFDNTPLMGAPNASKGEVLDKMSSILGINITSTCVMTSSDVLQQQGITDLSKLDCLWITLIWGFFFRMLQYIALLYGNKNKRA